MLPYQSMRSQEHLLDYQLAALSNNEKGIANKKDIHHKVNLSDILATNVLGQRLLQQLSNYVLLCINSRTHQYRELLNGVNLSPGPDSSVQ